MDNCLFCKIIKGEIPSYTLYEDEIVKVFLDINPSTNGDCLIVPKKHIIDIYDMDQEIFNHMLLVEKRIFDLLKDRLHCEGMTIVQNNGYGQEVKHFHIHMTPRYSNDNLDHVFNKEILKDLEIVYKEIMN